MESLLPLGMGAPSAALPRAAREVRSCHDFHLQVPVIPSELKTMDRIYVEAFWGRERCGIKAKPSLLEAEAPSEIEEPQPKSRAQRGIFRG